MELKIAVLPGDYIGPEVMEATLPILEKALKKLSSGEKMINIAYECGFTNLRTFNRAFKRVYNMTPSEYKKTCAN